MAEVTLLLIEDDAMLAELTARGLRGSRPSWAVLTVPDGEAALAALREHRPQVVLLDIDLGRESGLDLLEQLRRLRRRLPVVVVSAGVTDAIRERLGSEPLTEVIDKPFEFTQLTATVEALVEEGGRRRRVGGTRGGSRT